jgi:hypothetical protein
MVVIAYVFMSPFLILRPPGKVTSGLRQDVTQLVKILKRDL